MINTKLVSKSSSETKQLAVKLAKKIKLGDIILLYGDLGSGKTTFTQGLAEGLEIKNKILSPTFVLMRDYNFINKNVVACVVDSVNNDKEKERERNKLYHVDLYRIDNAEEIESIGLMEIVDNNDAVLVVEWAERLDKMFSKLEDRVIKVYLSLVGENIRKIKIVGRDKKALFK